MSSNQKKDVRQCLKACDKMKLDQDICRKMCFRQFWKEVFDDVSLAADENGIPRIVWLDALTTEFETKFGMPLVVGSAVAAAANGS